MTSTRSRPRLRPSRPARATLAIPWVVALVLASGAGCVRTTVPAPWPAADREASVPEGGAAGKSDDDPMFRTFLGKAPPDRFRGGTWVNTDRRQCLSTLRCNVVVLAFLSLSCPACAEFFPHLVTWEEKYAAKGATIVYVDNGRQDTLAALQAFAADNGVPFALFHDRLGHMLAAYGIRAFPTVYVVDRDGKVTWENVVPGLEAQAEKAIEAACAK